MSTTETLRTQLDNVHCELHQLQVENKRLRVQGEGEALEQLKEEVAELRQQLHVAQENEAGTNQNLRESREEVNELKQQINELQHTLDSMRSENKQLADELAQSRARHSEIALELSRERESSEQSIEHERVMNELKCYCTIEAERIKSEAKETRLLAQLELLSSHGVSRGTSAHPTDAPISTTWSEPERSTLLEGTIIESHASNLTQEPKDTLDSPLTGYTDSSVDTLATVESSTATVSVANPASLSVPTVVTPRVINTSTTGAGASGTRLSEHTSIRVLGKLVNASPLDAVPGPARSGSDRIPVSSTLNLPLVGLPANPVIANPGRIISESSGSLLPSSTAETSVARTVDRIPIHSTLAPYLSMMPGQQLPPISKFSGEDSDGEGESFED